MGELQIDLSALSFEEASRMAVLEGRVARLAILQERLSLGKPTADLLDALMVASAPESMEAVFVDIREQMAKVVTDIPQDWFVKSAPKAMKLSDPETYKWLRADKARLVREAIQKAQAPEEASKNLVAAT
jgi:hypothetical protein